jgi:hypothetical protein
MKDERLPRVEIHPSDFILAVHAPAAAVQRLVMRQGL